MFSPKLLECYPPGIATGSQSYKRTSQQMDRMSGSKISGYQYKWSYLILCSVGGIEKKKKKTPFNDLMYLCRKEGIWARCKSLQRYEND